MTRPTRLLVLLALSGCVSVGLLQRDLDAATALVDQTRAKNGVACAPVALAQAEGALVGARNALSWGDAVQARAWLDDALVAADAAWTQTAPCGDTDRDGDGIPDVVDQCPDQPEDRDGIRDDDGCRDVDPGGDLDGDGVVNIDDLCLETPEDLDGDQDDDGCPETSEDSDGDGIVEAADRCPNEPEDVDGFKDVDGCPDPDNDADAILDRQDGCPDAPEDADGWMDDDGCPDPDNDGDGILDRDDDCPNNRGDISARGCPTADADGDGVGDADDRCPTEPETPNGYLDQDGCPDQGGGTRIAVTPTRIETGDGIAFVEGSATLKGSSAVVLDEVARTLRDAGKRRLRIEGHTDASGDASAKLVLSRQRAEAVLAYLVARGVAASRLEAAGFGGQRPIDTNRTASGRAANNRVELWWAGD